MTWKTYKITSFGCQMNAYDSEVMAGVLEGRGLRAVEREEDADVVLLNTCIVRGSAEQRAWGRIERLKPLKAKRPGGLLGVCGCLAQRDAEGLLDRAPHLDLVLGTRAIPNLSALLDRILSGGDPIACVEECDEPYGLTSVPVRKSSLRALVTIVQGCDNWCSYCIVPSVRGREKSRPLGTILDEVRALVACGCREVTLVGQNVNAWRGDAADQKEWREHNNAEDRKNAAKKNNGDKNSGEKSENAMSAGEKNDDGESGGSRLDFADLLERVDAVPGLERIRYITSHPRDAGERHVNAAARLTKVCDHFHLPAQSGSNAVLERMNRGYTREHYLNLVDSIRRRAPDATITTDLIVGFPGETEDDFLQTLDLVERVRFDAAFTFFYNVREGTRAAEFEDDVPIEVKKERLARLIEIQGRISLEKNRAMEGETVEILVEGPARRATSDGGRGAMKGRTTGDKTVVFDGAPEDEGRLVQVRITEGASHTLFGQKVG